MKRVSIERIVIDAPALGAADAEWLRERLEEELQTLLAGPQALDTLKSQTKVSGGELPVTSREALPRVIAEKVAGALGGET